LKTTTLVRSFVAAVVTFAASVAGAANWAPVGPADAFDPFVATNPAFGAQVLIVAGNPAYRTTYYSSSGGFSWEPHARPGGGGKAYLAGNPAVVYLAESGTVQRSNDLGRSFFPIALPAPPPSTAYALAAVNPSNADELVAWAGATVSQSLDGGATWASSPAPGPVGSLVVDWETRRLYADLGQLIGYRPLDAPAAWGVGGGPSSLLPRDMASCCSEPGRRAVPLDRWRRRLRPPSPRLSVCSTFARSRFRARLRRVSLGRQRTPAAQRRQRLDVGRATSVLQYDNRSLAVDADDPFTSARRRRVLQRRRTRRRSTCYRGPATHPVPSARSSSTGSIRHVNGCRA
jgi:hypothetical protein